MHITWAYALLSGTGSFANNQFLFNGTIHQMDGTVWPMKLSGGKSRAQACHYVDWLKSQWDEKTFI